MCIRDSVANAWEHNGDDFSVVACCWPPDRVAEMARDGSDVLGDWRTLVEGDFSSVAVTQLVRFDSESGDRGSAPTVLCRGAHLDHAKVHPRKGGTFAPTVYASAGEAVANRDYDDPAYATPQPPQAFVRVHLDEDDVVDAWYAGRRRFVDDAVLVPHPDDDDSVFVVAPVFDASTLKSTIVILDGGDLAAGPLCELALPDHAPFVPWGLHGAWCAAS